MQGRAFILNGHAVGFSDAMQALHEHACGWLQTVDAISVDEPENYRDSLLSRHDGMRAADLGYRGDSVGRACRFMNRHDAAHLD